MARKTSSKGSFEISQIEHKINIERKHKLTLKQQKILKTILNEKTGIVIIDGPAGTSKTYLAVYAGLQEIKDNGKHLMYLRSVVENSNRKLGALPGTLYEKFNPFMEPLMDKLDEFLSPLDIRHLHSEEMIDAKPINYLRGADWKDKFVIIDEAQNMTKNELLTALTRAGEGTKIILCGDLMQSDIRDGGFAEVCKKFADSESVKMGIHQFSFEIEDIVRSPLVKFIVSKFH